MPVQGLFVKVNLPSVRDDRSLEHKQYQAVTVLTFCASAWDRGSLNPVAIIHAKPRKRATGSRYAAGGPITLGLESSATMARTTPLPNHQPGRNLVNQAKTDT